MASTLTSPLSSIDPRRLSNPVQDPSFRTTTQMSQTPADTVNLSPYSVYPSYSNSTSPSAFDTPPDNGGYSEFSDYNGEDEFFGVDFDATGTQDLDASLGLLEDIPIPSTEVTPTKTCLPETPISGKEVLSKGLVPLTMTAYVTKSQQLCLPPHVTNYNATLVRQDSYPRSLHIPKTSIIPLNSSTGATNIHMANLSGSSLTSTECTSPGFLAHMNHSPRVTITPWGTGEERELPAESDLEDEAYGGHRLTTCGTLQDSTRFSYKLEDGDTCNIAASQGPLYEKYVEAWDSDDNPPIRTGIGPERRMSLSAVEIPNLKEQIKNELLEMQLRNVAEWRAQTAGDSIIDDDANPAEPQPTLGPPNFLRRRAKSTGAAVGSESQRTKFERNFNFPEFEPTPQNSKDPEEGCGIEPVSDAASIRENRLQEGQSYFNIAATEMTTRDFVLLSQSRHFNDSPSYPTAVGTISQPDTANAAIAKYNEAADTYSVLSRSATWGTRRRSEPSLADIESIKNGSFIKRLSFGKEKKEKKPGIFKESFGQLTNIVRKKSESKLKRSRSDKDKDKRGRVEASSNFKKESQASLAPPARSPSSNRRRPESPRLNTNITSSGLYRAHSGSSSISGTSSASPKNTFGFVGSAIRRARSKSDLTRHPENEGLVGLWRVQGGPPVPTLASPPVDVEDIKPIEHSDVEGDDDEEDDLADDCEKMDFDQTSPISPTLAGFREHVLRLNPNMEATYLVDRIAHQQVVRYKALLNWRVKHSGAVNAIICSSGNHCITLGGSPTLYDTKGKPRNNSLASGGLQVQTDFSDGESNPEGHLSAESFPTGVPMPPATSLPAEFECQLCFKVKKFQKPSDWTKHVHEDVQPFTCTYASCREPKSFKRKADWVRHENERHRHLEWWTCQVDDCSHKCFRKDNFLQHLVREHKLPEPKQKTKAAVKNARGSDEQVWVMVRNCHHETQAKPQDELCKFCGKILPSWKKLTVHLAKHMEHISLPVLRLVEQRDVNADTIISPVEPLPARATPLTPTNMIRDLSRSSAPYSMSTSISPNAQVSSHFASPNYHLNSPNLEVTPQFQDTVYTQASDYIKVPSTQSMGYSINSPMNQQRQHHDLMFDHSGMSLDTFQQGNSLISSNQPGTCMPMDPGTNIDQPRGFTTVNQIYSAAMSRQIFNDNNLRTPNQTLRPDTSSFIRAQQNISGFPSHRQSLTHTSTPFASAPQENPGYQAYSSLGLNDNNAFSFPTMSGPGLSMEFAPESVPESENSAFSSIPQHALGFVHPQQSGNRYSQSLQPGGYSYEAL